MLKTIALSLAMTTTLFAQGYGTVIIGDQGHFTACVEICREYKQCVYDGESARAQALFIQFWQTCSADEQNDLPDLIWVAGTAWCPEPDEYPPFYTDVTC